MLHAWIPSRRRLARSPGQRWSAPLAGARRAAPYALLGLAVLAPFAFSAGDDIVGDMVLAAAYVVMALGLNIVVGFAGLLDLGYVAFYAIGAYTAAHLASGFWDNAAPAARAWRSSSAGRRPNCPAST